MNRLIDNNWFVETYCNFYILVNIKNRTFQLISTLPFLKIERKNQIKDISLFNSKFISEIKEIIKKMLLNELLDL